MFGSGPLQPSLTSLLPEPTAVHGHIEITMSRHDVDEAAVLKLYGISSLNPQVWESIDHDKEGPLAGTLAGEDGGLAEESDPLGLRKKLSR